MKIALIAHDKKKDAIIELAKAYKDVLACHELYATGTTGTLIMGETALPIHRMKSGPLGGDQQIGAMLADLQLDWKGIAESLMATAKDWVGGLASSGGVVIGGVLLAGLYTLFNTTVMPTLSSKITEMFTYSGT